MAKTVIGKWGWVQISKDFKPEERYFDSADEALQHMRTRLDDADIDLLKLEEIGLRLATVIVTIEADMMMIPLPTPN